MTRRLRLSLTLTAAALAASVMVADERVGAEQTAPPSGQGAVTQGQPGCLRGGEGGRAGGRGVQPRTRKALLAWADTRNGIAQHAFTSHALAIIERLGYETGLWDTFIRTDSNIIFDQAQKTDGSPASGGPSLSNVDGIFFLGHRDVPINDQQKAELLAFVRSGKGFVAAHTGLTAFESWPEFGEMLGATYGGHLYTGPGRVVSEQPGHPIVKHLGGSFDYNDEFYKAQAFSREKIDVLLRFNACQRADIEPARGRRLSARLGEDLRSGPRGLQLASRTRPRPGIRGACRSSCSRPSSGRSASVRRPCSHTSSERAATEVNASYRPPPDAVSAWSVKMSGASVTPTSTRSTS